MGVQGHQRPWQQRRGRVLGKKSKVKAREMEPEVGVRDEEKP